MEIQSFFYNDDYRMLYLEFVIEDIEYSINLDYDEIQRYTPIVITEDDLMEIDLNLVTDIVNQYILTNGL
jgi:hypothetical protein